MDHWQKKRLSLRARLVLRQSVWFTLIVIALACVTNALEAGQFTRVLFFMVLALTSLHMALAWMFSGHALQPLERMSEAARQIAFPEDARRPLALSTEEVEHLSEAINDRLQHLHQSSQQINEFLPDVSHELRRTLSALRAETERALRWATSEEEYRQALSNQLEQIELSTKMLSDMFVLAQTESGGNHVQRKMESLSELVGAAVDSMHAVAAEHGIEILQSLEESVLGEVDAGQIWRLLLNLLDNAIKYNRPSGRVEVVLASHGKLAMMSVSDTGCGIPKADMDRIFDRFYRSPEAVRSGVQGTGLGLCFARSIVEAHGGRIEVNSSPGEGSCFRIWLPLMSTTALAEYPAVSGSQVSAVN